MGRRKQWESKQTINIKNLYQKGKQRNSNSWEYTVLKMGNTQEWGEDKVKKENLILQKIERIILSEML